MSGDVTTITGATLGITGHSLPVEGGQLAKL